MNLRQIITFIRKLSPYIPVIVILLPATFKVLESVQELLDAFDKVQRQIIIAQVEQNLKLDAIVENTMALSPATPQHYDDYTEQLDEILECVKRLEEVQSSKFKVRKMTLNSAL